MAFTTFVSYIYNLIPSALRAMDTNVDNNGNTLLDRYLGIFGAELDANIYPQILGALDVLDAKKVPVSLLPIFRESLGNPPLPLTDNPNKDIQRNILKNIFYINKVKGTTKGYELLFNLLGLTITLNVTPISKTKYDVYEFIYDDDINPSYYNEQCNLCYKYSVTILDPNNLYPEMSGGSPPADEVLLLFRLIKYDEPINMKLTGVTFNGTIITLDALLMETGNPILTEGDGYPLLNEDSR